MFKTISNSSLYLFFLLMNSTQMLFGANAQALEEMDRLPIKKELQNLREQDPLYVSKMLQNLGEKIFNSKDLPETEIQAEAQRLISLISSIEDHKLLSMDEQSEILMGYMEKQSTENMAAVTHCLLAGNGLPKEAQAIRVRLLIAWDAPVAFLVKMGDRLSEAHRKGTLDKDCSEIEESIRNLPEIQAFAEKQYDLVRNSGVELFKLEIETELFRYIDKKLAGQEFS